MVAAAVYGAVDPCDARDGWFMYCVCKQRYISMGACKRVAAAFEGRGERWPWRVDVEQPSISKESLAHFFTSGSSFYALEMDTSPPHHRTDNRESCGVMGAESHSDWSPAQRAGARE